MSELIVDAFEAVHIQQDDAEGTLRAARAIEFGFQYAQQSAVTSKSWRENVAAKWQIKFSAATMNSE